METTLMYLHMIQVFVGLVLIVICIIANLYFRKVRKQWRDRE